MGSSGCRFPFPTGRAWSPGTVGISIRVPHPLLRALPAARGGSGPWSLLDPANSCSWESRAHPGHAPGQGSTRSLSWWRVQQQSWRAVSELGTPRGCGCSTQPQPQPEPRAGAEQGDSVCEDAGTAQHGWHCLPWHGAGLGTAARERGWCGDTRLPGGAGCWRGLGSGEQAALGVFPTVFGCCWCL